MKTIKELTSSVKGWTKSGVVRYYCNTSSDFRKAGVFWAGTKEKSRYAWPVSSGGYFHAEKSYNGCIIKDLRSAFSQETIGELEV